ncbi:MAG: DUF5915 domain-containing protein [Ardenticatenia bacterium]|nr:DUF5915 domain-containing protein [Ardenticatenia bacterium]
MCTANPEAPESVHLADFPAPDRSLVDEALNDAMNVVQKVVRLGLAARNRAGIKVRQPLAELAVACPPEEQEPLRTLADLMLDELNVKALRFVDAEDVLAYRVKLNPAKLGPRLGAKLKAVQSALQNADQAALARALRAGEPITLRAEGEEITVAPDEASVEAEARPGYAVAVEGPYAVAVATEITDELRREGIARELARHLNQLRKEAGLELTDRIEVWLSGVPDNVLAEHADYLKQEALAVRLEVGEGPAEAEGTARKSLRVNGVDMTLVIRKVDGGRE